MAAPRARTAASGSWKWLAQLRAAAAAVPPHGRRWRSPRPTRTPSMSCRPAAARRVMDAVTAASAATNFCCSIGARTDCGWWGLDSGDADANGERKSTASTPSAVVPLSLPGVLGRGACTHPGAVRLSWQRSPLAPLLVPPPRFAPPARAESGSRRAAVTLCGHRPHRQGRHRHDHGVARAAARRVDESTVWRRGNRRLGSARSRGSCDCPARVADGRLVRCFCGPRRRRVPPPARSPATALREKFLGYPTSLNGPDLTPTEEILTSADFKSMRRIPVAGASAMSRDPTKKLDQVALWLAHDASHNTVSSHLIGPWFPLTLLLIVVDFLE